MDGNTTADEEEEFIEALQDEMPKVFKTIEEDLVKLDAIDVQLEEVKETKNIDTMTQLKKDVDEATKKVE